MPERYSPVESRGGWEPFIHLFPIMADEAIAEAAGKTVDAVRLKRRRLEADRPPLEKVSVPHIEAECVNFNIGFYDIETSFSRHRRLMTAAVVDGHGKYQLVDYYTHPGKGWWDDSQLIVGVIEMLRPFHILVGWNSKRFDLKVINGRAAVNGLQPLRPQLHLDLMNVFKYHMDLGGNSLQNISEVFESEYHKIRVTPMMHQRAESGDREAYDLLREHNIADVFLTRDVFPKALPYVTSITKSPIY